MATISSGGVAQDALAANPLRRGMRVQNQSSGDLRVRKGANAALDDTSIVIPAGSVFETIAGEYVGDRLSIIGATTGQAYYVEEW